MRSKIAQLYLPLINITCDALEQLWNPTTSTRPGAAGAGAGDSIDMSIAQAISTSNLLGNRNAGGDQIMKV